mmetsp:Transcript_63134/g.124844  ORF Transcript_63134/g.124844 Transcript_63134/m.124844 type:complete len:98 (+) Transcript_63134:1316-1609(+)
MPCTGKADTGSSMRSQISAEQAPRRRTAAIPPMAKALVGLTESQPAQIETRPIRIPLQMNGRSHLDVCRKRMKCAMTPPAAPLMLVFVAANKARLKS